MDKIHLYDKVLSPMVTEKSTNLSEQNKIVFKVPTGANKINLKKIDVALIKKYTKKNSSSIFQKLKFLNHQISYEYQMPIKNIKLSTYLNHFKIKVLRKLRFKYH